MNHASSASRRFLRHVGGAAAVEFALIIPLLVATCLGIFEGGRMMWLRNSIQTATEEAARYAMTHAEVTDTELQTIAGNYFSDVTPDTAVFAIGHETIDALDYVSIDGSYVYEYMFPFFDFGNITLSGRARTPLPTS